MITFITKLTNKTHEKTFLMTISFNFTETVLKEELMTIFLLNQNVWHLMKIQTTSVNSWSMCGVVRWLVLSQFLCKGEYGLAASDIIGNFVESSICFMYCQLLAFINKISFYMAYDGSLSRKIDIGIKLLMKAESIQ